MKVFFLLQFFLISFASFAQDTLPIPALDSIPKHTQIFSLSPISKKVDKVNGLVFGVGHIRNKNSSNQTINGLNIEANPAPAVGALMAFVAIPYLPYAFMKNNASDTLKNTNDYYKIKNIDSTPLLKMNGINISTGCFFVPTNMNGLNISTVNKFNNFNGISITPIGTIADNLKGISIGIVNANNTLMGSTVGVYNFSYDLKGLHIGVINSTRNNRGLQLGVFNRSYSKGFQIGLWNVNNKRSMPFINW